MGIEPILPAWEAGVLPLNYICIESGELLVCFIPLGVSSETRTPDQ